MKTVICQFKSNGENIKLTAVVSDDLSTISKQKKNQATDIIDDDMYEYEAWGLFFEVRDHLGYEIQLKADKETHQRTLKPIKAITWEGGEDAIITDVQKVTVKVK